MIRNKQLSPGASLRYGVGVVVSFILLVLSGCATTGVNKGDVNLVSLEEEWQLGQQLERDIAQQMPLITDPTSLGYISRIGQRLVAQTEMAQLPWEFHIVADPAINAFNTPGGHVYINTGLINAVDNVSELVGVVAHEIAHGVSRHSTERLTKAYGLNIGAGLLLGQNPAVYEQILAQIIGGGAIAKFSRSDEQEADRLGVRYMYRSGYDPQGMVTMFQKLMQDRGSRPGAVSQFFSTHPLTEDRIDDVRAQIRQLPAKGGLTTRDGELASIQRRLAQYQ